MTNSPSRYPRDSSDGLVNVVLGSIATLILALLGLILWMNSGDEIGTAAAAGQTELGAVADDDQQERVPSEGSASTDGTAGVPATGAETGNGSGATSDADGSGSGGTAGGADDQAPDDDDAQAADGDAQADGAADAQGGDVPNPGRGSGLFSKDDPARVPAITVRSSPRGVQTVTADFDGDDNDERAWSAVVGDQISTRLDRLVDGQWKAGRAKSGAPADRLIELRAQDLTGDGLPEVYTKQWVATEGESVTLWSVEDGQLQRMPVSGGCWADNDNTVGLIGAEVTVPAEGPAEVVAICKDKPRPPQQWPSALYRWRQDSWVFEGRLGAQDGR